jgi:hypothetical protein
MASVDPQARLFGNTFFASRSFRFFEMANPLILLMSPAGFGRVAPGLRNGPVAQFPASLALTCTDALIGLHGWFSARRSKGNAVRAFELNAEAALATVSGEPVTNEPLGNWEGGDRR